MAVPNIVAFRIDERLIHGQGQLWIKALGVNTVIVANDSASEDSMQQTLMKAVVPKTIAMRFFSIQHTCDVIMKASPKQTIFIVCKTPDDALKLVAGGVPVKEINVGNITNQDNSKRAKWSAILGILTFVFGIPSALSYGIMADVHILGKTFFDAMDFLVSNLLMPFGAICLSLFTGYIFKKALAMEELHLDETAWKQGLFQVWLFLLRFIIPIIIIVVFIAQFM